MQVSDLKAKMGGVGLRLQIVEKGEPRTFEKFGKSGKVANVKGKDPTGTITLSLWNEDVDKVEVGDTVEIENGWVGEYQGELQLSTGKFGKLEVVEKRRTLVDVVPPSAPAAARDVNPRPEGKPVLFTPVSSSGFSAVPAASRQVPVSPSASSKPEPLEVDEGPITDEEFVQ